MHVPPVNKLKNRVETLNLGEIIVMFKPYYIGLLVLLILFSGYHILFSRKLIPGVYVAGLDLGGFSYDDAVARLEEFEVASEKTINITYGGKSFDLKGEEIGLEYSWDATVNRAFEVGRTSNFFVDTKEKLAGLVGKDLYIAAFYEFEEDPFDNFMATVRGDLNSPAEDAHYFLKNKANLGISTEFSGQKIDDQEFYNLLIKSFDEFNFGSKAVTIEPDQPEVFITDLEKKLTDAERIVFNPLKLVYEVPEEVELEEVEEEDAVVDEKKVIGVEIKEWELTLEQKLDFLTYDPLKKKLGFDKVAFRSYLEGISSEVNQLPRGKVTEVSGGRVLGFQLYKDGVEIDTDETTENFKDAYFGLEDLAYVQTKSISGPRDAQQYGIFALLGEGVSRFTGSATGRINNLTLAASRTDGVLVPPGSIYSFNDAVGEISAATGYDSAWIIYGNQTILGHGGGVCQTSTTLFRAILNAGLPVVTRHPHAYRVYYYEIESPVGIDASVYQPTLDLRFKNDTPNYVLVQTNWDLNEYRLVFRLYGTPDGRKVEISEPVVTNVSGAPAPEYKDDPELAKRDGEIIYDDTFKTNYQPWKAVFLVGTKEE